MGRRLQSGICARAEGGKLREVKEDGGLKGSMRKVEELYWNHYPWLQGSVTRRPGPSRKLLGRHPRRVLFARW
jgi:hypothetical protein